MKKIDYSLILSICAIALFISGIITFAVGGNNTSGFLFTTTGFLFLTIGISFRRKEESQAKESQENEENADKEENK